MYQIGFLLKQAIGRLTQAGCDTPRLDAEVILAHLLSQDRGWLYAHNRTLISEHEAQQLERLIQRRMAREPVAYITGRREFFGLIFEVSPAVLIPRPETELLVEEALALAPARQVAIADIGTGSGCIAISLARHLPQAIITAIDISLDALTIARRNADQHHVADRIRFRHGDLLAPLTTAVDILVANPPYVSAGDYETLAPEVRRYEPRLALVDQTTGPEAGTGLSIIHHLLSGASKVIYPGGYLLMEIGADQGQQVLDLAAALCPQARFEIRPDLAGRDRLLLGNFNS